MKLKSRGLGRRELIMDFREYEISREGDEIVIAGTIREPVTWDFSIRISEEDIPGLLRVGVNHNTLRMGARWFLHRHPKEHDDAVAETAADRAVARRQERAARAVVAVDETSVLDEEELGSAASAAG